MKIDNYLFKAERESIAAGELFVAMNNTKPTFAIMLQEEKHRRALLINVEEKGLIQPPSMWFVGNIERDLYILPSARIVIRRDMSAIHPLGVQNAAPLTLYSDGMAFYLVAQEKTINEMINITAGTRSNKNTSGLIAYSAWDIVVDGPMDTTESIFSTPV